jgi:hypothetical protein
VLLRLELQIFGVESHTPIIAKGSKQESGHNEKGGQP